MVVLTHALANHALVGRRCLLSRRSLAHVGVQLPLHCFHSSCSNLLSATRFCSHACVVTLPPPIQAAHEGSWDAVKALMRTSEGSFDEEGEWRTPVVNTVDAEGDSMLLHATALGSIVLVRQEVASGSSLEAALRKAAQRTADGGNHFRVARVLVDCGADVGHHGQYGATPLTWAAFAGHAEMVSMLMDAGATANSSDSCGDTALITAVKWSYAGAFPRYADAVRVLVANGADPNQGNNKGETARSIAASRMREEGYEAVLDALDGSHDQLVADA